MGELILCHTQLAAIPYYLEDSSLNVYSLEELSYYLAHNADIINREFMCPELCNWIGRSLGLKELENALLDMIQSQAPLHRFVGTILANTGYLTKNETKEVVNIIAGLENQSEGSRRKMRADRLMEKNKIVDAIYEYENILTPKHIKEMPPMLVGDIWHNLGTAYARLFFFEESGICFEQAYLRNHRRDSLRQMLYAFRCGKNEKAFMTMINKYHVSQEEVDGILQQAAGISKDPHIIDFAEDLDNISRADVSRETYEAKMQSTLHEWILEYKQRCRI